MGKGMRLCLCIAHVYLDRIVLVLVSICVNMKCMNMCDIRYYVEGFLAYMYTHMYGL